MINKDPSNRHFYMSIIKSVIRLAAGVSLMIGSIYTAGILLIAAEVFGVAEEL